MAEVWARLQQIDLRLDEWRLWLAEVGWPVMAAGLLLLLALAWFAGWQQKRRRTQTMLAAVKDATFGRCIPRSRTGAWGFAVAVEPPPDRFREFNISYQPVSILDPVAWPRVLVGGQRPRLLISGVLVDAPTAELIWARGHHPARALGVNPGRAPWVQSKLDYVRVEFATRGTNVAAMRHTFQDLMARFTPILQSITIQRERRPHFRLVAEGRIEARDVSPLITAARTFGRAAMME